MLASHYSGSRTPAFFYRISSTNKLIFMNLELWYTNELIGRNLRILWFEWNSQRGGQGRGFQTV